MPGRRKLGEVMRRIRHGLAIADSGDLHALEVVRMDLAEIQRIADVHEDVPVGCARQMGVLARATAQELGHLLHSQGSDTAEILETVRGLIDEVEDMIMQLESPNAIPTAAPQPGASAVSEQEKVIPQEDVPMVLDFVAEAREHLDAVETGLAGLEARPDDRLVIQRIFQAFHTIKGMAGFLNLPDIGALARSTENLLDMAHKDKLILQGLILEAMFESTDQIKERVALLRECAVAGRPLPPPRTLADLLIRLHTLSQSEVPKAKAS
jgi:HPt (histidine-containing phosphotransfer) domain-containing protein